MTKRKKKRKKKKLTIAQIAKQLRDAKIVKSIEDARKESDKRFRKIADNSGLTPSINLNAEIRQKATRKRANAGQIRAQKNRVRELQQKNRDLKNEYPFTEDERKREIERQLKTNEQKLFTQKNILKQYEGKNFDFIVDDGFKKYKINSRELKKYWRTGGDASIPILKRMQRNNNAAIRDYKKLIQQKKKTATPAEMKKLKRILNGLENKLAFTIEKNIQALETGDASYLDEVNEFGEKAYSILNRVVGFNIDRVGI